MASYVILHPRNVVRPISDYVEVSRNFQLSHTNRLSHTQGVCRNGEERLDCLLPELYKFRTSCFRDSQFSLLCVASWYDPPPSSKRRNVLSQIKRWYSPTSLSMNIGSAPSNYGKTKSWSSSCSHWLMVRSLRCPPPIPHHPILIEDALALFIIVYSAKRHRRDLIRVGGVPSLLGKILQDATTYFLILSTGQILFFFFEVFAPVSDRAVDLCSAT